MLLSLSDVNKKVRYRDAAQYGNYEGLLIGLSTDHSTAFVEWDSFFGRPKRESVHSYLLEVVERTDTNGTQIEGGALWKALNK